MELIVTIVLLIVVAVGISSKTEIQPNRKTQINIIPKRKKARNGGRARR